MLRVDRAGGVVTATIDRPEKRNAADDAVWDALDEVLRTVASSPDDRVLVVTGAGGAFCSGADLDPGPRREESPLDRMRRVGAIAAALHDLPKPTIAMVDGAAVGAGCNLALGCDLVYASDRARFSQIFVHRALSLDFGGSWLLPRLVGLQKAKELAFLGEMVTAEQAAAIGIVNAVVPVDELASVVAGVAARLAALPPTALAFTKELLNDGCLSSFGDAIENESLAQCRNLETDDHAEAKAAFLERRDPVFTGR